MDSNTGFKNDIIYEKTLLNLKSAIKLAKASGMDVSKYENAISKIESEIKENPIFDEAQEIVISEELRRDFLSNTYYESNVKLDVYLKEFKNEFEVYYKIYLLSKKISELSSNVCIDNISKMIEMSNRLIKQIDKNDIIEDNPLLKDESRKKIVDEGYNMVYLTMLYESQFDRNDILNLVKNSRGNIGEKINSIILRDAINVRNDSFVDYFSEYKDEKTIEGGFEANYFDEDFIKELARVIVGEANNEFRIARNSELAALSFKLTTLIDNLNGLNSNGKEITDKLKKAKSDKLKSELLSFAIDNNRLLITVPLILTLVCGTNGVNKAITNPVYKTTTETIDVGTGKKIEGPLVTYDEHKTSYVVSCCIYSPYRKNPNGSGYLSLVNVYSYDIVLDEVSNDFSEVTRETVLNHMGERIYTYSDVKQELGSTDSMDEYMLRLTGTYQNMNEKMPNFKYVVSGIALGVVFGAIFDLILYFTRRNNFNNRRRRARYNNLLSEIDSLVNSQQQIQEDKKYIKQQLLGLKKEYQEFIRKYGYSFDQNIKDSIEHNLTSLDTNLNIASEPIKSGKSLRLLKYK